MNRIDELYQDAWSAFQKAPVPAGSKLLLRLRYWPSFEEREILEIWQNQDTGSTGPYWGRAFLWDWPKDLDHLEHWEERATNQEKLWARYRPVVWKATVRVSTDGLSQDVVDPVLDAWPEVRRFVAARPPRPGLDGTSVHVGFSEVPMPGEASWWSDGDFPFADFFTRQVRRLANNLHPLDETSAEGTH